MDDVTLDSRSPDDLDNDRDEPTMPALHRHKKRTEWGLAILAWDRRVKRGYQFQDGEFRIFAKPFFGLMEEVDRPADEARKIVRNLVSKLDTQLARKLVAEGGSPPSMSFEDQMGLFRALYPEGFADDKWLKDVRGEGVKRRLKRHRNAALDHASEALAKERLGQLILDGKGSEVWQLAIDVANGTDLVSKAQMKPLLSISEPSRMRFANALSELLYGPEDNAMRLAQWVRGMEQICGTAPSWQLATLFMALVHPQDHVAVRPSTFREQALWMAPRVKTPNVPDGAVYGRLLRMANVVRERLTESGLKPRDLMDVHDFMRLTLSPTAKKKWEAAKESVSVSAEAA